MIHTPFKAVYSVFTVYSQLSDTTTPDDVAGKTAVLEQHQNLIFTQ